MTDELKDSIVIFCMVYTVFDLVLIMITKLINSALHVVKNIESELR